MDDKNNEITAIPAIDELDTRDAVVSIDAIGCQREIVAQISGKGGHYPLTLRENQKVLSEDAIHGFDE